MPVLVEMRTYKLEPGTRPELEGILMPMIDKYDVVLVDDPEEKISW